jgi:hypothetical protein
MTQTIIIINYNNNSVASFRERTTPTEGPPLVGKVSANSCGLLLFLLTIIIITTPWLHSESELYRPSDCRLSAKLVPTLTDYYYYYYYY